MSQSDEEESIFWPESLKGDLAECLDNIQSVGSFALFEPLKSVPNPGVVIGNYGIGLPLSSNDARTIVSTSHPAPFGRGTETVLDPEVRKTWELSTNEFRLANPEWTGFVKQILVKIGEGMGLFAAGKKIKAELYKLLLYEEGAMFKPHQDSEKAPGMFGTLVIALPSKHEGGEVSLTHGGRKKTFETYKYSDFDYSYLAWFSDVIHEVKPIISGRRLVLTYNLIQTNPGQIPSASSSSKEITRLRSIFSWWKKNTVDYPYETPKIMAYLFDHHYTEASLSFNSLKGKDLQVATHLSEAAAEEDIYFCLANLDRTVTGDCGGGGYSRHRYWSSEDEDDGKFHTIDYVLEHEMSLVYVADLDGSVVARNMPFDEEDIVQEDVFDNLDPDDEEYEGHTGNAGAQATHFYHRTIAILMPRSHRIPFFLQSSSLRSSNGREVTIKWLDSLSEDLTNKPESAMQIEKDIETVCSLVLEETLSWRNARNGLHQPYSDKVLARVLQAANGLNDKSLFAKACVLCFDKLKDPPFEFFRSAVAELDLSDLLPKIDFSISEIVPFSTRLAAVASISFNGSLAPSCSNSHRKTFMRWRFQEFIKLLLEPSVNLSSGEDGKIVCFILNDFASAGFSSVGQGAVVDSIKIAVKRNIKSTSMVLALLNSLADKKELPSVTEELSSSVFKDTIVELIKHFDWKMIETAKQSHQRNPTDRSSTEAPAQVKKQPGLANLMCYCRRSNLSSELDQIIAKLCDEAGKVDTQVLDELLPPFLKDLIDELQEQAIVIADSPFRHLFQNSLNTYIQRYVMPEPKADDCSREELVCSIHNCAICTQLNEFLRSPTKRHINLAPTAKKDQNHLSQNHHSLMRRNCLLERNLRTNVFVIRKKQESGKHASWEKRYNHAKKRIEALGVGKLKELLEECYDFIVSMASVRRIVPSAAGNAQPSLPQARVSGNANIGSSASGSRPALSEAKNGGQGNNRQFPSWFGPCLNALKSKYPDDLFVGEMRYGAMDMNNAKVFWAPQDTPLPAHIVCSYLPSIKCLECPELAPFQSGPWSTLNTFESHLRDKTHRARVAARLSRPDSRKEIPVAQSQASHNCNSTSAAGRVGPLPQNRKRTIAMIDMTGDSD